MKDELLDYAYRRIIELENILLVKVPDTVWPAEVDLIFSGLSVAEKLPEHHKRRLKHHINRMWLERMPVPAIIDAARSLVEAMEKYA
jgi:hypothetical protein